MAIFAPGIDIESTSNESHTDMLVAIASGTSAASPFVVGLAAYLISVEGYRTPIALCTRIKELGTTFMALSRSIIDALQGRQISSGRWLTDSQHFLIDSCLMDTAFDWHLGPIIVKRKYTKQSELVQAVRSCLEVGPCKSIILDEQRRSESKFNLLLNERSQDWGGIRDDPGSLR